MSKTFGMAAMAIGLSLAYPGQSELQEQRGACVQRCMTQPVSVDPETQRQEIVNLEHEAARAIQLNDSTFFRRVYSDEFAGTLSHGQLVNKIKFIEAVQNPQFKYDSFVATNIRVNLYQETAVASCVWSARGRSRERQFSGQMRVLHVYVNGQRGWQLVASHAIFLPPDSELPL